MPFIGFFLNNRIGQFIGIAILLSSAFFGWLAVHDHNLWNEATEKFNTMQQELFNKKQEEFKQQTVVIEDNAAKIAEENKKKVSLTKLSQKLKHTEESKEKISQALKGIVRGPMSDDAKKKMVATKQAKYIRKVWMNKDGNQTKVVCEEVDNYLQNGWKKGMTGSHITENYKNKLSKITTRQWQIVKATGHHGQLIGI